MIKKIVLTFSVVILFLMLLLSLLVLNLDKVFDPLLIGKYQKLYFSEVKIDWSKINIQILNKDDFFSKEIYITSEAQCIEYKNSSFCHKFMNLNFTFSPFKKRKLVINEFMIKEQNSKVYTEDFKSNKNKKWVPIYDQLLNYKRLVRDYKIFAPGKVQISSQGSVFDDAKISTMFSFEVSNKDISLKVEREGFKFSVQNTRDIELFGRFKNSFEFFIVFEKKQIDFSLTTALQEDSRVYLDVDSRFSIEKADEISLKSKLSVGFTKNQIELQFVQLKTEYKPYLKSLDFDGCMFTLSDQSVENIKLYCPSNVFLVSNSKFKSEWSKKKISGLGPFKFSMELLLDEASLLNGKSPNLGSFSCKFEEKKGEFFDFNSEASARLYYKDKKVGYDLQKLSLSLKISYFAKLVEFLKDSALAVPAPLNAYKGQVLLKTKDLVVDDGVKIPFELEVRLKGEEKSRADVAGVGSLNLKLEKSGMYTPALNVDLELAENVFYLPDFDPIQGLPNLSSDPRIKTSTFLSSSTKVAKKSKGSKYKYNFSVKTKKSDSIKIYYKLFNTYMPLGAKLLASDQGLNFTLFSNKTWSVEYLKRKVYVEQMSLSQNHQTGDKLYVDAELLYKASEYDVFIKVLGDVDAPVVRLRSDPPLSRPDIISVLLYNRTSDDIDRFQSESVGGAEAAFSDRAIGLVGIWAFASTPIESVSYNTRTKTYRAQIGLPGGVKLDIGTDWERVQNLSLRKRVSKYWMVVTSYQPGSDENKGIGDVMLQREWIF